MKNLDTAEALLEGTTRKDLDLVVSLFASDAEFSQPYSLQGPGIAHKGTSEIRDEFRTIFKQVEVIAYEEQRKTVSADGMAVIIEVQGDMTLAGSRKNYQNFYVFRFDFDKAGKIQTLTEYMNSHYLAKIYER